MAMRLLASDFISHSLIFIICRMGTAPSYKCGCEVFEIDLTLSSQHKRTNLTWWHSARKCAGSSFCFLEAHENTLLVYCRCFFYWASIAVVKPLAHPSLMYSQPFLGVLKLLYSFSKLVTSVILFLLGSDSLKWDISGMYIVKFLWKVAAFFLPITRYPWPPRLTCAHHTGL